MQLFTSLVLRFRITATVEADDRLEAVIFDGPMDASRPVRQEVVELGQEFKYRQVSGASVFHNAEGGQYGEPNESDDGQLMRGLLRDRLVRQRQRELSGASKLAGLRPDVGCGDVVAGVGGRGPTFERLTGGEYLPQVRKVVLEPGNWITEIEFGEG